MNALDALTFLDGLSEEEFALHGSELVHSFLVPNRPNQSHLIPDYNECAVYGTCVVEIAILYATIRESTQNWGWRIVDERSGPNLLVVGPQRLRISSGHIHIIKREKFTKSILGGLECLAYEPIKTEQALRISLDILEHLIAQKRIRVLSYEEFEDQYPN